MDCFVAKARRETGVLANALWLLAMTLVDSEARHCERSEATHPRHET
jgi:hypothetical protein